MSTPQSIAVVAPRFRIRQATLLAALGVLAAIAVSIVILAVTSANHTAAVAPVTASEASSGSVPAIRYLGPRQVSASLNPQTTATTDASNAVLHYCLGAAQRCLP